MSREEMDQLCWDSWGDIIPVTGDAYADRSELRDGDLRTHAGNPVTCVFPAGLGTTA